jgi:hypothetical protein
MNVDDLIIESYEPSSSLLNRPPRFLPVDEEDEDGPPPLPPSPDESPTDSPSDSPLPSPPSSPRDPNNAVSYCLAYPIVTILLGVCDFWRTW